VAAIILAGGLLVIAAPAAYGGTAVGCTTTDLVNAVTTANSHGGGTLSLAANCNYTLSSGPYNDNDGPDGLPIITAPLIINGGGATISRSASAPHFRLLEVSSSLTVNNLTLSGGNAPSFTSSHLGLIASLGGGVLNHGTLTLNHSTVSSNTASQGGFQYPNAGGLGGGINNAGELTLNASTVTDNVAGTGCGGGIYGGQPGTSTLLINSIVYGNTAGSGGGLCLSWVGGGSLTGGGSPSSSISITGSTIAANTAENAANNGSSNGGPGNGGGIDNTNDNAGAEVAGVGSRLTITNSTISGNSAANGGGVYSASEGIAPPIGSFDMSYSTIADNSASNGGGIDSVLPGLDTIIESDLVADNPGGDCGSGGGGNDTGYNLDSDKTCDFTATTDRSGVNPELQSLGNYGGPTTTMAVPRGSPAVGADGLIPKGTDGCGTTITKDQRGVVRSWVGDAGCDIGAYQYGYLAIRSFTASPNPVKHGAMLTLVATVTNANSSTSTASVIVDNGGDAEVLKSAKYGTITCPIASGSTAVTCDIGHMGPAQTILVTVVVEVTATSGQVVGANARVLGSGILGQVRNVGVSALVS